MGAPRLARVRLSDALRWVADGRVPTDGGGRVASSEELVRFAAAALAPLPPEECEWCSGSGCPACDADQERYVRSRVLRVVREHGPISGRRIDPYVDASRVNVMKTLEALHRAGLIRRTGSGRHVEWSLVPADALPRDA